MNTACMPPAAPALPRALAALRRRLNAMAYDQVNEELALMAIENDNLRAQLIRAEENAEFWHEQAMAALEQKAEATGGHIGMTQDGQLLVVGGAQHG